METPMSSREGPLPSNYSLVFSSCAVQISTPGLQHAPERFTCFLTLQPSGEVGQALARWAGGFVTTQISSSFSHSGFLVSEDCPACNGTFSPSLLHQHLLGPSLQVRSCSESTHLWTGDAIGAGGHVARWLGMGSEDKSRKLI